MVMVFRMGLFRLAKQDYDIFHTFTASFCLQVSENYSLNNFYNEYWKITRKIRYVAKTVPCKVPPTFDFPAKRGRKVTGTSCMGSFRRATLTIISTGQP